MTDKDAQYLAAVEAGDMETAQRMIDDAARDAGKEKFYHVGKAKNPSIRNNGIQTGGKGEFYLTSRPDQWIDALDRKGQPVQSWYLDPKRISTKWPSMDNITKWGIENGYLTREVVRKPSGEIVLELDNKTPMVRPIETAKGKALPFYGVIDPMRGDGGQQHLGYAYLQSQGYAAYESEYSPDGHEILVFNPNQIKSADPVTYDSNGNVIPLSRRFNQSSDSIYESAKSFLSLWN